MSKIWGTLTFFANVYPMNSVVSIQWNFCTTILIPLFWCFEGVKREGKGTKNNLGLQIPRFFISFRITWSFLILINWSFLRLICKFKFLKIHFPKVYYRIKSSVKPFAKVIQLSSTQVFCEQFNLQNCLPVSVSLCSAFGLTKNLIHVYSQHHVSSPVKDSV